MRREQNQALSSDLGKKVGDFYPFFRRKPRPTRRAGLFKDMYNGEIISFRISKVASFKNVADALEEVIKLTADCPYRRTFYSDQVWAYQKKTYVQKLKDERIFQSMSRKGNCHDNAVMGKFFGLLKQEMYYGEVYYSYEKLKKEIERYIKYYNEQ